MTLSQNGDSMSPVTSLKEIDCLCRPHLPYDTLILSAAPRQQLYYGSRRLSAGQLYAPNTTCTKLNEPNNITYFPNPAYALLMFIFDPNIIQSEIAKYRLTMGSAWHLPEFLSSDVNDEEWHPM